MSAAAPRPRVGALALAVGLVLADSSVVVLALPQIYRELDTSVAGVTWVLVSFNLVMALAAVPAALVARRVGPGRAAAVGLAIFAGAGLACGASSHLSTLIVARCVQALGGAAAVTAALELLPATVGSERRATVDLGERRGDRRRAGAGDRRHPHRAGLLAVDLPAPGAGRDRRGGADPRGGQARGGDRDRRAGAAQDRRPHVLANLALALVSAAIAAALFLLVLLLIEGWRLSPIGAAIVVTVMPLLASWRQPARPARPRAPRRARRPGRSSSPAGSAGWRCCRKAEVVLTVPPQVLVGVGLSLVLSALTETALHGRAPQAIHGGWTISARHAGVVDRPAGADPDLHRRHRPAAPRRDRRRHGGGARLPASARC